MRPFFYTLIICLFFLGACSQQETEQPASRTTNWSPPRITSISQLPDDQKPKLLEVGKKAAPVIHPLLQRPHSTILPVLTDGNGQPILDSLGNTMILGQGGISQFKRFTSDEGLSIDGVECAIVDSKGHIWFGTNGDGVNRFDGTDVTVYGIEQGLAGISIRSLFEDSRGNIWIGTADNGVSKFDGKTFTHFTEEQIGDEVVYSIYEATDGTIWFGTGGQGITSYDGSTFTNWTMEDGIPDNVVISILEDKNKNLWIGTYGGGVARYDGEEFETFSIGDGFASDRIRCIFQDQKGDLWFGSLGGGVTRYNNTSFTSYGMQDGLAGMVVRAIKQDQEGTIWFATDQGVSKWTGSQFVSYTTEQGLVGNNVSDIAIDQMGKIWFCTDGSGASRLDGIAFTNFTSQQGLSGNIILSLMEDSQHNLWIGTADGGVNKFDGKSILSYTPSDGLAGEIVYCILEDQAGKIWFGTAGNGLSILDKNRFVNYSTDQGLPSNEIYALIQSHQGYIWIGTDTGLIRFDGEQYTHYTKEQGLAGDIVVSILEDQKGVLWIGSLDGGVTRFDGETFSTYSIDQGLTDSGVLRISEDKAGNLWIGTENGLSYLSAQKKQTIEAWDSAKGEDLFLTISSQDGLPDDVILQVLDLGDGRLAVGTNTGISTFEFHPDSAHVIQQLEVYHSDTGYPVKDLTDGQNGMFLDSSGILWAGTGSVKTGLVRFDINKISENTQKPQVLIKQVRINEEVLSWETVREDSKTDIFTRATDQLITLKKRLDEEEKLAIQDRFKGIQLDSVSPFFPIPINLKLPFKHNHLNIEYGSNELARPFLIEYQYILEGYDPTWSPVLKRTSATFGNIQEGDYTFKVRARYTGPAKEIATGWTEPIEFSFTVLPPWYRSWWAYLIYTALILSLLYPFNRYMKYRLLKAEWDKAKERELEHARQIEVAYTELASAHENLKSTQSQLIQAEKMASLGELTAGIAHEIQNPLNFVKNFSEVSHELMDEMNEEIEEGDFEDAKSLAKEIQGNLDRISTHSMRADAIVKAMLQHSKASMGSKETVDLNTICDEAIRLSFHGLRAKDANFEVEYSTNFATGLPQIEVIRQEMTRALINMCINAFQASHEKALSSDIENYKPQVRMSTKKILDGIEIELADNGVGISKEAIAKIFQPFFTTKPTGQGTGLGLSLSYDIIKSYQGDIRVLSSTGSDSETIFTIFLPTKT
ncbi:two-component regulator propeller domain-containing protein [Algoriphagus vanfongensis]|uniref:two-component regulator propeller domain-containing protein n=1 Tax=Algoriphagus vanfongensis TaxID=426371 RepID=UPI00040CB1EF|nr:two-component regulator propeller domain-containing protein [Algoriphagus vanfongensis]